MIAYLLVNFGGPRNLEEISPFLQELLRDRDVIWTKFPTFFHNWLFGRIARKRSVKIAHDYQEIGGKSPIYDDTEELAKLLSTRLNAPVIPFHRYLPSTHAATLHVLENLQVSEIRVLPLFPQFCYATTGSIARFFSRRLTTTNKLRWIKSYPAHPAFIQAWQTHIAQFLASHQLPEQETALLFSAHGVPQSFISAGDIYESECRLSYREILKGFPKAVGRLAYQSKFGPEEWLTPSTEDACASILEWHQGRPNIVIVPLTFTSDHIETLFEIEKLYLPILAAKNLNATRCPALNLEPYWIDALVQIIQETNLCGNQMLIRKP